MSATQSSPLESIYGEISGAIDAKLFYLAIAVSLSLPDLCAALEGKAPVNWETYKDWFRANAAKRFRAFNEHDCFELRCGVLHQGRFSGAAKKKHSDFDGIFFTLPNRQNIRINELVSTDNGGVKGTWLSVDAVWFCESMIASAREWEVAMAQDATVQANLPNLVRYRPEGLSPHVVGIPVIA